MATGQTEEDTVDIITIALTHTDHGKVVKFVQDSGPQRSISNPIAQTQLRDHPNGLQAQQYV